MLGTAGEVRTSSEAMFSMGNYTWTYHFKPTNKNLHQLCADTGCTQEELPRALVLKDREREREREMMISKLAIVVEGEKVPFSIATTPKCR